MSEDLKAIHSAIGFTYKGERIYGLTGKKAELLQFLISNSPNICTHNYT